MTRQPPHARPSFWALVVVAVTVSSGCESENVDKGEAELDRVKTNVAAFSSRLAQIARDPVELDKLHETPCPPEEISDKHGGAKVAVMAVERDVLLSYTQQESDRPKSEPLPFLTSKAFHALPRPLPKTSEEATTALDSFEKLQKGYPYIVVIEATELDAPKVLEGWVMVYDVSTGKRRCEARIRTKGVGAKDFEQRVQEDITQVVATIGKQLRVEF